MDAATKYDLIGRYIYGFQRVKGVFDDFCRALQPGALQVSPETPISEIADSAEALLMQRYGADSLIVENFSELAITMRSADEWTRRLMAKGVADIPDEDRIASVLSCPQRLAHIRQLISAV